MFSFITHRPLWVNILTGLLLALIVFLIFILSLNWLTHHNESKTVPSVVGKTYNEAEKILGDAGFDVEVQDSLFVDTARPMSVLRQIPEDGEIVKVNRIVYLVINRARPPLVEMPSLKGFSFRSAVMELVNRGLDIGDTIYKSSWEKDAVLETRYQGNPIAAGTKIPMGSKISFVLGSGVGTERFVVPNLKGFTFCDVKALIESHGLVIGSVIIMPGADVTDTCSAYVWKQRPARYESDGTMQYIRSGQTIDVWLQKDKPAADTLSSVPLQQEEQ